MLDAPFKYDSHGFRTEHQHLEDDISSFVKTFREIRKNVFTVTEQVIDSEEFVKKIMSK